MKAIDLDKVRALDQGSFIALMNHALSRRVVKARFNGIMSVRDRGGEGIWVTEPTKENTARWNSIATRPLRPHEYNVCLDWLRRSGAVYYANPYDHPDYAERDEVDAFSPDYVEDQGVSEDAFLLMREINVEDDGANQDTADAFLLMNEMLGGMEHAPEEYYDQIRG